MPKALPLRVDTERWSKAWDVDSWRHFLDELTADADTELLRAHTHTGRPLGNPEFVQSLQRSLHRILAPQKGGRPRKPDEDSAQSAFNF